MPIAGEVEATAYDELSGLLNGVTGSAAGFGEGLCARPWRAPPDRPDPTATHAAIRDFLLTLARLWLEGEWPRSHRAPTWGAPVPAGALDGCDPEWLVPCFVRTDESVDGRIFELQCAGGWWGIAQALSEVLGSGDEPGLAAAVADEIEWLFPQGARILHLFDSAGLPHDSHFFAQRVRSASEAIRYRGIDPGLFPVDCNFVRGHSYGSVVAEDHFRLRLPQLRRRQMRFDHPPLPVFDQKLPMALPFDPATAHHFSDAHRSLFPYTALIRAGRVTLASGEAVSLADLFRRPPGERRYYLKYAGMDATRNYGARAVFDLSRCEPEALRSLQQLVASDGGEPWILQEGWRTSGAVEWVARSGERRRADMSTRLSVFHGPRRPLAALFLAQPSSVVHGGDSTVVGIVEDERLERAREVGA